MGALLQLLAQVAALGAVYACIAVGFSLIFAATRVSHFGAGNVAVLGGVVFAATAADVGGPAGLVIVLLVGAALGAIVYLGLIRPGASRGASEVALSIGALAVGLLIDALVGVYTGNLPQVARPAVAGAITVEGSSISTYSLYVVVVVTVLLAAVWLLVYRTLLGKAMLAVSYRPAVAVVSGVNERTVVLVAWVIGSSLMTAAGALFIPISVVTRGVGLPLAIAAFAAAVLGGLGSLKGAIVGALVVALSQTLFSRYVDAAYVDVFVFGLLFALLVLRPSGLFGLRAVRHA